MHWIPPPPPGRPSTLRVSAVQQEHTPNRQMAGVGAHMQVQDQLHIHQRA